VQSGNGFVGIGTTTPRQILSVTGNAELDGSGNEYLKVYGNAAATAYTEFGNDASGGFIYQGNDGLDFRIQTSNTDRLHITSGGNVGIGTSSPSQLFSVAGNDYITGGEGIGLANSTPGTLRTSGNALFGGNVGIGTTSPYRLGLRHRQLNARIQYRQQCFNDRVCSI
jgi:hypothetical protein